jgi:hypothetical protein
MRARCGPRGPARRSILLARAGIKIPEKPAPLFGELSYDDAGRYFGSIVELAPAGRTSPAWTGTLYSVNSRGEHAVVTHPSWDGYWTGAEVPTVTVLRSRAGVPWGNSASMRSASGARASCRLRSVRASSL